MSPLHLCLLLQEIDPSYSWVQPVLAGVGLVDNPAPLHRDMHAFLKGTCALCLLWCWPVQQMGGSRLSIWHGSAHAQCPCHLSSN